MAHAPPPSSAADEFDLWFPAAAKQSVSAHPRLRLILFPSSGTMEALFTAKVRGLDRKMGPNALMAWAASNDVEVLAVQLPGRGKRHNEPPFATLSAMASALGRVLEPRLRQGSVGDCATPYAVVGHSMGAWAAFELVRELCGPSRGLPPPRVLVTAAFPAPDVPLAQRPWTPCRSMGEEGFKAECRGWGINEAVLATPHLWESFRGLIKADFTLFDEYDFASSNSATYTLPCPVVACAAAGDARISADLVRGWARFSAPAPATPFELLPAVDGPHNFLLDEALKAAWVLGSLVPTLEARCLKSQTTQLLPPPLTPLSLKFPVSPLLPFPTAPSSSLAGPALALSASLRGARLGEDAGNAPAVVAAVAVAASAAASPPTRAPLRVLCLHGFGGCGDILEAQTGRMRSLVEADLEKRAAPHCHAPVALWDFLSSPDDVHWDPTAFEARLVTSFFPGKPNKQWMRRVAVPGGPTVMSGPDDKLMAGAPGQRYEEWEGPLEVVLGHLAAHGPYDCVLGFSQGANLAALLCALQDAGLLEDTQRFKACVCVCGSAFGWREQWATGRDVLKKWPATVPLFAAPLVIPSLHLVGTSDPLRLSSAALAQLFNEPRVEHFKSGHKPPTQTETALAVADFFAKVLL